jgi:hypothetical protein
MRLCSGLVSVRGWLPSWRVLVASLVLVMVALAGGASLRQVQALQSTGQMTVNFSPSTPPVSAGVICKDQDYQVEVRPVLNVGAGVGPVPLFGSVVLSLTRPDLGTLNGRITPEARITNVGGAAVFTYRAQRTGQETLNFGFTRVIHPEFLRDPDYANIPSQVVLLGSRFLTFEVRECTYVVGFVSTYQFAQGGVLAVNFGLMAQARLERNEDGTFAGNSSFIITNLVTSPVCIADYADVAIPTGVTGTVPQDSDELELTFAYRKGTLVTNATCHDVNAQTSTSVDISGVAPKTVTFPKEGGSKSFPLPGPGRGQLMIIVKQADTQ